MSEPERLHVLGPFMVLRVVDLNLSLSGYKTETFSRIPEKNFQEFSIKFQEFLSSR